MGFGSCTVSIFSCPASATLAGRALFFFRFWRVLTLTLLIHISDIIIIIIINIMTIFHNIDFTTINYIVKIQIQVVHVRTSKVAQINPA